MPPVRSLPLEDAPCARPLQTMAGRLSASGWKDPNHLPVSWSVGQPEPATACVVVVDVVFPKHGDCLRSSNRGRRTPSKRRHVSFPRNSSAQSRTPGGPSHPGRKKPASHEHSTGHECEQQATWPSDMTNQQADRGTESRRIPTSGPGGLSRASLPNQSVPFPWAADLNDSLRPGALHHPPASHPFLAGSQGPRPPQCHCWLAPLFSSRTAPSVCVAIDQLLSSRPHPNTLWTRSELQACRR
jgi:hypothetical protein